LQGTDAMPGRQAVRFRRSPYLVGHWVRGELWLQNFATGVTVLVDPLAVAVLDFFDGWQTTAALEAALGEYSAASVRSVLARLARETLLERSDRPPRAAAGPLRAWRNWQQWIPSAGFFHFASRDVPYVRDLPAFERSLRARARVHPPPPPGKHYPRAAKVALSEVHPAGEFPRVLLARRTWRRFGRAPVEKRALAALLKLSFGVHGWLDGGTLGRYALKTSPSGGALSPLEAYVAVRRVRGLAPGIYHYDSVRHRLARLRRRAPRFSTYLPAQRWYDGAAILVLVTAVFARPQWKYPSPRTYRVLLAEAGHLAQTFCLTATWLGLAPFSTMALADSRIERDLGIDGVSEAVLYAVGAGSLPPRLANPHLAR
jgi:SagB-type dehydrogenase family enzyme